MKSLKFADLKGTKTAVNCRTQEEWDKVTAICGYEWVDLLRWGEYRENSCISLNGLGYADTEFYRYTYRYTIIPASDFIAANTTPTPDLSGTRPAIEWLPMLPEPYNKLALEAVKVAPDMPNEICEYKDCISLAIRWAKTKDSDFFDELDCHLKDPSHPLPPINPERLEHAEQPKEESDQREVPVTQTQFEFLLSKIESLKKELDSRYPKKENTEPPQPEPKSVVLPVTVEDVLEMKRYNQYSLEVYWPYLHEKTAKKTQAFGHLNAIAEAQNEIVPRGDRVYYAQLTKINKKIIVNQHVPDAQFLSGLIYFHSEQGLSDCIEANKELWMDLLRG